MLLLRDKWLHELTPAQLKDIERDLSHQLAAVRTRLNAMERMHHFETRLHRQRLELTHKAPWKIKAENRLRRDIDIMRKALRGWSNAAIADSLSPRLHPDTVSRIIRRELTGQQAEKKIGR